MRELTEKEIPDAEDKWSDWPAVQNWQFRPSSIQVLLPGMLNPQTGPEYNLYAYFDKLSFCM
jgi:hypothetical protein